MAYEKYREIRSKEDFYSTWESDKLKTLNEELKEYIYIDYVSKCEVLQRDNFTCQNKKCQVCGNKYLYEKLSIHHIKAKRKHKTNHYVRLLGERARNKVTLCRGIHTGYERGKNKITFSKESIHLPPHIRGHTFKYIRRREEIDWKKIVEEGKRIRKENRQYWNIKISWEMLAILMKFMFEYEYENEEDL